MDCPKCNLRYNNTRRKPKIIACGHSICEPCVNTLQKCIVCGKYIQRQKTTFNLTLLQMIQDKKMAKQIDKFVKVCFIGESKVGKTSLISRLKGQEYRENTITTIGYDFAFEDREIDGLNVRFQLWDSAGQERYRAISPLHYKNANIIVLVYDVTEGEASNNMFSWYEEAKKHSPEDAIKILVGNKVDLLQKEVNKKTKPLDANMWDIIAEQKIANYQISCKTYDGIEEFWVILDQNVKKLIKQTKRFQNSIEVHEQVIKPIEVSSQIKSMSKSRINSQKTRCC